MMHYQCVCNQPGLKPKPGLEKKNDGFNLVSLDGPYRSCSENCHPRCGVRGQTTSSWDRTQPSRQRSAIHTHTYKHPGCGTIETQDHRQSSRLEEEGRTAETAWILALVRLKEHRRLTMRSTSNGLTNLGFSFLDLTWRGRSLEESHTFWPAQYSGARALWQLAYLWDCRQEPC